MIRYRPRHLDEAWTPPRASNLRMAVEITVALVFALAAFTLVGALIGAWPEETQVVRMETRR